MTKFYDDSHILTISMIDNTTGTSFEADFFEVGSLPYDSGLDAYKVDDVEYLADYARDYANGVNPDFEAAGNCTVSADIEVR